MADSEPTQEMPEEVKPEPGTEGAEATHLNLKVKAQVCTLSKSLSLCQHPGVHARCLATAIGSIDIGIWDMVLQDGNVVFFKAKRSTPFRCSD